MIRSLILSGILALSLNTSHAQVATATTSEQKVVIVTGARFSYKLVQKWIDEYNKAVPDVQIIIESRGSADPAKFDVLAEVYQQEESIRAAREYVQVGRYAVLPVAAATSKFAETYSKKGLTKELIQQVYFHNVFADKDQLQEIKVPYTVYTRLQKAGVPIVFSKHFGFNQADINGKAIAGSDEHLLKALSKDSTGISYLPLPLAYDLNTRNAIAPLIVLPIDLDGNGKVSDDEKIFSSLDQVIQKLEDASPKEIKNVPVEYLHLSVDKKTASPEAIAFLKWVNENGQKYLHEFGYLSPGSNHTDNDKFNEFASRRAN
jgi:phosphate transport system substrate-binding protein